MTVLPVPQLIKMGGGDAALHLGLSCPPHANSSPGSCLGASPLLPSPPSTSISGNQGRTQSSRPPSQHTVVLQRLCPPQQSKQSRHVSSLVPELCCCRSSCACAHSQPQAWFPCTSTDAVEQMLKGGYRSIPLIFWGFQPLFW